MLASVRSAVLEGIDGRIVTVEVCVSRGLPGYTVVGLPDTSGRESRERVRAALLSSGLDYPKTRITVNLAPAAVRKAGAGLELAIALALLHANDTLPAGALDDIAVLGELGLDGRVRPVVGALGLVRALVASGVAHVIVPEANAAEATLVPGARGTRRAHARRARVVHQRRAGVARSAGAAAPVVRARRHRRAARPRRRARARVRPLRTRDRGCGRAPRIVRRASRRRQDDARPPPAHDHGAAHAR